MSNFPAMAAVAQSSPTEKWNQRTHASDKCQLNDTVFFAFLLLFGSLEFAVRNFDSNGITCFKNPFKQLQHQSKEAWFAELSEIKSSATATA